MSDISHYGIQTFLFRGQGLQVELQPPGQLVELTLQPG